MDTEQLAPRETDDRSAYAGVLRFYELAKRAEWQVRDLPWDDSPPIPEYKGSPQKLARRRDLWRSVIMQQLQADMFAVQMASQLLNAAPHPEARLYYSTMAQDEARHTEAWLKLMDEAGGKATARSGGTSISFSRGELTIAQCAIPEANMPDFETVYRREAPAMERGITVRGECAGSDPNGVVMLRNSQVMTPD